MSRFIAAAALSLFVVVPAHSAVIASGSAQPGQFVEVLGPLSPGQTTRLTFTVDVAQPLPRFVQQVTQLRQYTVQVLDNGFRNIVIRDEFPLYTCTEQSCPASLFGNLVRSDTQLTIDIFALSNSGSLASCDTAASGVTCFSEVRSIGFRYLHQPDPNRGAFKWTLAAEAVPEPATWGMLITGFAAVGIARRRGRSSKASGHVRAGGHA